MRFEALSNDHELREFCSGRSTVDNWLQRSAKRAVRDGTASVYVLCEEKSNRVIAYVALCSQSVPANDVLPGRMGLKNRHPIPALLIAQMGVDRDFQGRGLGIKLLRKSFEIALDVSEKIGIRLILTHALDDLAAAFYRHNGFDFHESAPNIHYVLLKDLRETSSRSRKSD